MVLRERRLFRTSLMVLILALAFVIQTKTANVSALAHSPAAAAALTRPHDPVVVKGIFIGTPAQEIYVFRFQAGTWEAIPFQVDIVDADGNYLPDVTGNLDANDEIVFMASDLGEVAAQPITTSVNVQGPWYQVEVTDPLNPSDKGYAYVVHSATDLETSDTDYADFDASSTRINTGSYAVGWAAEHNGLDYISLFGSGDVLDRTKVRLTYRVGGGAPETLTEEGNTLVPVVDVELIKDGPVRVITSRSSVLTFGYQSLLRTVFRIDLSAIPLLTVENVRSSTDLTSTVTGTYYNQNLATGVPIDGVPDTVGETPMTQAWRQVSLSSGAMIQVTDLTSLGGFPRHYYKDDATVDPEDTGDGQSRGDSGFLIVNPTGKVFTLDSNLYFVEGEAENRGDEFLNLNENPVTVATTIQGEPVVDEDTIFMPYARKE